MNFSRPLENISRTGKKKDTCSTLPPHIEYALDDIGSCLDDLKEYLEVVEGIHHPCGGTRWRRVAFINTYDPQSVCPGQWNKIPLGQSLASLCSPNSAIPIQSCFRATFPVFQPYTEVCGRVHGIASGDVGGFSHYYDNPSPQPAVDDFFATGVILSRGAEHIWSFIAGTAPGDIFDGTPGPTATNKCPCLVNENVFFAANGNLPDIVGSDYYCEAGPPNIAGETVIHSDYPLWDGLNCETGSMCCNNGAPPFFTKTFTSTSMDPVNADLCVENQFVAALSIKLLELYVR